MRKVIVTFLTLLTVMGCYDPPETGTRPERTEVRVVYIYIDRDDCMRGMAPAYMHCDWGFYGRNRFNVMPMRVETRLPERPFGRVEPRRGTPPVRPEGARPYQPRPNRPEPPHNRPDGSRPVQPPKPPLDF